MPRLILALVFVSTVVVTVSAFADPPANAKTDTDIINRLDAILKRLDAIEKRLAKLEATNRLLTDWWVDDRGVMRSTRGRPIGFWGIDGPSQQPKR